MADCSPCYSVLCVNGLAFQFEFHVEERKRRNTCASSAIARAMA